MSDQIRIDKPLITPIYSQDKPSQTIDLGKELVQFEHEGKKYEKTADVKMEFLPGCDLHFIVPLEEDALQLCLKLWLCSDRKIKLTLPERNVKIDVFAGLVEQFTDFLRIEGC